MESNSKFDCTLVTKYWNDLSPIINTEDEEELYTDHTFPPNENSLLGKDSEGNFLDQEEGKFNSSQIKSKHIEWKRITEILGEKVEVFQGKIHPEDVKQGGIGNCYFLSSLAALSDKPYLIYQLFRTKRKSRNGLYELVLYIDGLWQVVFIDDYFPVNSITGKLSFSEPNGNELWVILLEKAWAKINGGYSNTIGGNCSEPLYALTGFSNEILIHKEIKQANLWSKMKLANDTNNILCSSTYPRIPYKNGLVPGHAYTIIDVVEARVEKPKKNVNDDLKSNVSFDNISNISKLSKSVDKTPPRTPVKSPRTPNKTPDRSPDKTPKKTPKKTPRKFKLTDKKKQENEQKGKIIEEDNKSDRSKSEAKKNFQLANFLYKRKDKYEQFKEKNDLSHSKIHDEKKANDNLMGEQIVQLIKLRNPWGECNWRGKYWKRSELFTDKLKEDIDYSEEKGTFYVTLEEFEECFELSFICHIMYNSFVKCYLLDYEEYFYYPLIFNLYLEEDSKVSLSLIFNSWRYDRTLRGVERAVSLVLANYNNEREIISLDGEWSSLEGSLEFVRTISKGFYCVWIYLPYEYYSQVNKPLECVFRISSVKEIYSKFVGIDKSFRLMSKFIVDYVKLTQISSIQSCENYYQCLTDCLVNAGITSLVIINKTDNKSLAINLKINDFQNLSLLPPYKGNDIITESILPNSGSAVIGVQTSYESPEFSYKSKQKLTPNNHENEIQKFDDFLQLDVPEDDDEQIIKTFTYTFSSETKALKDMEFNYDEEQEGIIEEFDYEDLVHENPHIMGLLANLPPCDEEKEGLKEKNIFWTKKIFQSNTYYGLACKKTGTLNFRGGLIFKNGDMFIGHWENNVIHKEGQYYDNNKNLIYNGNYLNGKKHGFGHLYFQNGNKYEGYFVNDKLQGKGIYVWKNKIQWAGNFHDSKKHGIGIIKNIKENTLLELVEFKEDIPRRRKRITQEISNMIAKEFESYEENSGVIEEDILKDILNKLYKLENAPTSTKNVKKNLSKQYEDTLGFFETEKNELDFENQMEEEIEVIKKARFKDDFAVNLLIKHLDYDRKLRSVVKKQKTLIEAEDALKENLNANQNDNDNIEEEININHINNVNNNNLINTKYNHKKNIQKQIIANHTKDVFYREQLTLLFKKQDFGYYLGEVNKKNIFTGIGLLYHTDRKETYIVGKFEKGVLQGFGESFLRSKDPIYRGEYADGFYHGNGVYYYVNGDKYEGNFKNNYMHGEGIYYWADGSCWKGRFNYDKFQGDGKFYYVTLPFSEIVKYDDNVIISRHSKINENIPLKEEKHKLENLKDKYFDVFERLLLLPPVLDSSKYSWVELTFEDDSIYVGQINDSDEFHGRGCFIQAPSKRRVKDKDFTSNNLNLINNNSNSKYNNNSNTNNISSNAKDNHLQIFFKERWGIDEIKYYIGYWLNGVKHKRGYYYNHRFQLIYEGEFDEDVIHGRGRYYYLKNLSYYDGEFSNNMKHGEGVYNWQNYRWEGIFFNDKLDGTGYFIYDNYKLTELIEYDKGNIIKRTFAVTNSDKQKKLERLKQINELKISRETVMNLLLNLPPTEDDICLDWKEIQITKGRYIGQVNSLKKPQGRGAIFFNVNKQYYVGYWKNGCKQGQGVIYHENGRVYYEGNFNFDERTGRGKYYLEGKNDFYEGIFDEMGNGEGIYFWESGYYWKGKFAYHQLDGHGRFYNPQKTFIKKIKYKNGVLFDKNNSAKHDKQKEKEKELENEQLKKERTMKVKASKKLRDVITSMSLFAKKGGKKESDADLIGKGFK